jgi:hypothetical protein
MALVLADRVQQTGTANTTVSFTLSGSVVGFQSFAVVGNGNTTYYSTFDTSGNWEVGVGTYSTTGPTLTRTTVIASSNSGLAVTFSGSVNVFITYPSERSVNLDESTSTAYAAQFAASNGLLLNNMTVATSYSVPSGYSATSTGPITVSSGVSVTIPSGSRWVVL